MIHDTYHGESPTKKLTRIHFWDWMRLACSPNHSSRFLVLASRECGDISFLVGTGVRAQDITAVDLLPEAIDAARSRFPGVDGRVGDVVDVVHAARKTFTHAFLDFCGPVSRNMIDSFFRVALDSAADGAAFAVGFMRGRERDGYEIAVRRDRDKLSQMLERGVFRHPNLPHGRGNVFSERLLELGMARRCLLLPLGDIYYHSRSKDEGGVPMQYRILTVIRDAQTLPRKQFAKRVVTVYKERCRRFCEATGLGMMPALVVDNQMSDDNVRKFLIQLTRDGIVKNPELVMNVSSETLRAWKAHETRGTYDEREPPGSVTPG